MHKNNDSNEGQMICKGYSRHIIRGRTTRWINVKKDSLCFLADAKAVYLYTTKLKIYLLPNLTRL